MLLSSSVSPNKSLNRKTAADSVHNIANSYRYHNSEPDSEHTVEKPLWKNSLANFFSSCDENFIYIHLNFASPIYGDFFSHREGSVFFLSLYLNFSST